MFKITKIDHVGIACKDLNESKKFYQEVLGLPASGEERVEDQGVCTVFVPCGESLIELLVDITPEGNGPIGKYIEKNGVGIQHLAFHVDDLEAAIADVQASGARMIDKAPRGGAGGMNIAFMHPKSAGFLLELCAPKK